MKMKKDEMRIDRQGKFKVVKLCVKESTRRPLNCPSDPSASVYYTGHSGEYRSFLITDEDDNKLGQHVFEMKHPQIQTPPVHGHWYDLHIIDGELEKELLKKYGRGKGSYNHKGEEIS